jgi:trehalose 6-phosphate synthase complex regulatory subunit
MSSLRNHRIVIASLFLPTTAVFTESPPPTPEEPNERTPALSTPPSAFKLPEKTTPQYVPSPVHSRSNSFPNPHAVSIVEDLKVNCYLLAISFESLLIEKRSRDKNQEMLRPQS